LRKKGDTINAVDSQATVYRSSTIKRKKTKQMNHHIEDINDWKGTSPYKKQAQEILLIFSRMVLDGR